MTRTSKDEYVSLVRARYKVASKPHKQTILDELCSTCDYHRKYATVYLTQFTGLLAV